MLDFDVRNIPSVGVMAAPRLLTLLDRNVGPLTDLVSVDARSAVTPGVDVRAYETSDCRPAGRADPNLGVK